ncbi:hypothetical protein K1719_044518 [Acacia pycnantha]|nr:hypothetical protein K1719_044518 [Acacia pycnantha]
MAFPAKVHVRLLVASLFIGFVMPYVQSFRGFTNINVMKPSSFWSLETGEEKENIINPLLPTRQMGKMGEKLDIDFVVSTGDNIYEDGLRNVTDPAFVQSFNDIYTAKLRASKSHGTLF